MGIPHTGRALSRFGNIPLHQYGAGRRTSGFEEHINNLDTTDVTFVADLESDDGVVHVAVGTLPVVDEDLWPEFSDNLGIFWYEDGSCHAIASVVDVHNLIRPNTIDDIRQAIRVVR